MIIEPAIFWTVVAARKGERKTAALKRLISIVGVSYLYVAIASILLSISVNY